MSYRVIGRALQCLLQGTVLLLTLWAPVHAQSALTVGTAAELQSALTEANNAGGNRTIVLADGTYTVADTLNVTAPHITITSQSGKREAVIIQGDAMSATAKVGVLIRAAASYFQISNVTLQRTGYHLLQVAGESNADYAVVHNVIFRDAYQQMLKVSIDQSNYAITGDHGLVEDSLFEYSAGVGPEYYIGGIDAHGAKDWIVRNNTFRSIISPSQETAEFAIHFWNQSGNALIEKNLIVNCDRGIGFGLDDRGNIAGIIRNNVIYHTANAGAFADVGIYIDQSPGAQIYNNTVYMDNGYPHSIEYRFAQTTGVLVVNNLTNKPVSARDGATGTEGSNYVSASPGLFVNPAQGNLRLAAPNPAVVDVGRAVTGLVDDFNGTPRPRGRGIDIGAYEWPGGVKPNPPTNVAVR